MNLDSVGLGPKRSKEEIKEIEKEQRQERREARQRQQKKKAEKKEEQRQKEEKEQMEKEWNENPMSRNPKWGELAGNIFKNFVQLCVHLIIGSRVVLAGKIAQFNVLPTDIECMPYYPKAEDEESPEYVSNLPKANIDYIKIKATEGYITYATKLLYKINDETRKNTILDYLREWEYDPEIGPVMKYILVVFSNIFVFWFGVAQAVYGGMNEYLNETLVLIIGPYILGLFFFLFIPVTLIVSTVIAVVNYGWLMKANMNLDPDYPNKRNIPVWRESSNYLMWILYFWIWLFVVLFVACTPLPYMIAVYAFLSPLTYSPEIVNESADKDEPPKKYGFLNSIQGLLNTKLDLFLLIFSILTVRSTFKYANIPCGIMVLLAALVFLYQIYKRPKKIPGLATSKLASNDQNGKFCPSNRLTKEELMEIARDEAKGYSSTSGPKIPEVPNLNNIDGLGNANLGVPVNPLSKGSMATASEPAPEANSEATTEGVQAVDDAVEAVAEGTEGAAEAAEAVADGVEAAAEGVETAAADVKAATEATSEPAPKPAAEKASEPEPTSKPAPASEKQTGGSLKSKFARKMAHAAGSLKRRKH